MKRLLATTGLALALGLGATTLGAAPADAAACIRQAALDLNGDGWVNTPEYHMATDAGFRNVRTQGREYLSETDMNRCLQGSASAFRWLQSANPRYASFMGAAPTRTYAATTPGASPSPTQYYSRYDSGAAYDTPTAQAHEAALAYLRAKVYGNPAYDTSVGRSTYVAPPPPAVYYSPPPANPYYAPMQPMAQPMPQRQYLYQPTPAPGPDYALLDSQFQQMDTNRDGVVTRNEYLEFMARTGGAY